jgi:hypothetical protein
LWRWIGGLWGLEERADRLPDWPGLVAVGDHEEGVRTCESAPGTVRVVVAGRETAAAINADLIAEDTYRAVTAASR